MKDEDQDTNAEDFDIENNSTVLRRIDRRRITDKTGGCDRCPPHSGENASRRPKDDRRKNHRRP